MDKKFFIYVLKDENNQIKYVGKTSNLKRRLSDHIYDATHPTFSFSPNSHKNRWIRKMIAENKKIYLEPIDECWQETSDEKEEYWINYYKNNGCKLTNTFLYDINKMNKSEGNIMKYHLPTKIKYRLILALKNYIEVYYGSFKNFNKDEMFLGSNISVQEYINRVQNSKNLLINLNDEEIEDICDYFNELNEDVPIEIFEKIRDKIIYG